MSMFDSNIIMLTGCQLSQAKQPCVYTVVGDCGILYVGVSKHGFARIFEYPSAKTGNGLRRAQAFELCKTIVVEFFDTVETASKKEIRLIHSTHPPYNKICSLCKFYPLSPISKKESRKS